MIAFRYTKTDGAEYLSHLDLMRHIDRTMRRAGIKTAFTEGFSPHPKIYMNNPLGLGIRSVAEYCSVESAFDGDFKTLFNAHSPRGIKCLGFIVTEENPNYAYTIESCTYTVEGLDFDARDLLDRDELVITDKRGRTADIRRRIYGLEHEDGKLRFTLGCGQNNLRPDLFCEIIESMYGGKAENLLKIAAHGKFTF